MVDRVVRRRQVALLSARAVPYEPKPQRLFDLLMLGYCVVIGLAISSIVAISQFAAVVKFFPYNLTLTWAHYDFDQKGGGGWASYYNSIRLALLTSVHRDRGRLRGRLSGREGSRLRPGPRDLPFPGDAPDGGAGPRPRARLHLLLQRAGESAQRALSHDDHSGRQHRRALLHRGSSDRAHRLAPDGSGVRDRVGLAEAARSTGPSGA